MNIPAYRWTIVCLFVACSAAALAASKPGSATGDRVNVRGLPSLQGEVITQLHEGETVVILEEVDVPNHKAGEPAKWFRIEMPSNTPVWVNSSYVDPTSKTVKPVLLNIRGGPGENFSVLGRVEKGTTLKEIRVTGEWMEIESPAGTYGFVAAEYIKPGEAAAEKPASPAPVPTTPAPAPKVKPSTPPAETKPAPAASPAPAVPPAPPAAKPQATETTPPASAVATPPPPAANPGVTSLETPTATPPVAETAPSDPLPTAVPDPSIKRVVTREGIVSGTVSIQAPTYFELKNPYDGKVVNYVHTVEVGIKLDAFRGRKILVTGEERVDRRWPKVPVIEVETIRLID